jgi:segregation and condensation protein A
MAEDVYKVKVTDIFEGPMDLLVFLIKKNEVNIYDIPVALITDQYLGYIEWMQGMNIDVAGDFILMAATLAQIKSRMLLPIHGNEEDAEDPRDLLTQPILEYLQMKSAAEQLAERDLLGDHIFPRPRLPQKEVKGPEDEMIQVGLFELIDAFREILSKLTPEQTVELTADRVSVKDRINQLVDVLEEKGTIAFRDLFEGAVTKNDIIVTFLAILEMVKIGLVRVAQHIQTGIIRLFYI